jgi:hypothetical protein
MWIIHKDGFVSLVQHDDDATLIRARARRARHLRDTFGAHVEIIDLGTDAPDYRYHANVPRVDVIDVMTEAILDLDYTSHVKEEVAGKDTEFYEAMMQCWSALYTLQSEPA